MSEEELSSEELENIRELISQNLMDIAMNVKDKEGLSHLIGLVDYALVDEIKNSNEPELMSVILTVRSNFFVSISSGLIQEKPPFQIAVNSVNAFEKSLKQFEEQSEET